MAVSFKDVSKRYRVYGSQKDRFLSLFSKKFRRKLKTVTAVQNLSFEIPRGQAINLVGISNSGKSTLLDLISGVRMPGKGNIIVNGKVSIFAPTALNPNQNMTCRRNMELMGSFMGMTKKQVEDILPQAIAFSELKEKIDLPMSQLNKSLRRRVIPAFLLFCNYDILLIENWMKGVDKEFKAKCTERLGELMADGQTTVICSSTKPMSKAKSFDRVLMLDGGRLVFDGDMAGATEAFQLLAKNE
jgi:teichoic acid transport system ATP-binding protein